MKYILKLENESGNVSVALTKPCNWRSVNESYEQTKCLEMKGQVRRIRMISDSEAKILRKKLLSA